MRMANLDLLVKALDTSVWELGEAFKGLEDKDVWVRPHPRLLSIGEIAAHLAYWEAHSFFGEGYQSPLIEHAARYYTSNVVEPVEKPMGAEEVYAEIKRIHEEGKAWFLANPQDSDAPSPHREGWTWGSMLEYQAFHFGYHTGQIYSIRHLMGHETEDN